MPTPLPGPGALLPAPTCGPSGLEGGQEGLAGLGSEWALLGFTPPAADGWAKVPREKGAGWTGARLPPPRWNWQCSAGCLSSKQGTGSSWPGCVYTPGSKAGEQCIPGAAALPAGPGSWSPHCDHRLPWLQLPGAPEGVPMSWDRNGQHPAPSSGSRDLGVLCPLTEQVLLPVCPRPASSASPRAPSAPSLPETDPRSRRGF